MALAIKQQLAPVKPGINGFGNGNKKKKVTIHLTGNKAKGANAQMHAKLQSSVYGASWHIQVDDKEAIQSFSYDYRCWHAGDGNTPNGGNNTSIGIEGCINSDGDYLKMLSNMAETAAIVCKDLGLDPVDDVVRHYDWSGKHCPAQIMDGQAGIDWPKFKKMILDFYNGGSKKPVTQTVTTTDIDKLAKEVIDGKHGSGAQRKANLGSLYATVQARVNELLTTKPKNGIDESKSEDGVFYPSETIKVRDMPSTKGNLIARYYKGEYVTYHTIHKGNGYVWLQYNRANGGQGYIPCRTYQNGKYGPLWGTIK